MLIGEAAVVVFGVASALSWGAADFSGGLASRRSAAMAVVVGSQALGLPVAVIVAGVRGEPFLASVDIAWASAASLSGTGALIFFYRALAVGRMSVVATVAAVISASFPLAVAAILEGLPSALQFGGMSLGVASIAVVSLAGRAEAPPAATTDPPPPDVAPDADPAPDARALGRPRAGRAALGLAAVAGLGFGGYYVLIDRVTSGSVFWPLATGRAVAIVVILAIALASRTSLVPQRAAMALVIVAGVLDLGGTSFFILAAQAGRLDIAAVLSSLYPVTTILLAALLLRERPTVVQGLGIAAAISAIVLIVAG